MYVNLSGLDRVKCFLVPNLPILTYNITAIIQTQSQKRYKIWIYYKQRYYRGYQILATASAKRLILLFTFWLAQKTVDEIAMRQNFEVYYKATCPLF